MKTTAYHRQGLRLLDAINFSIVYIRRLGMTCEFAYLGSSILAVNLDLIGRFVTPGLACEQGGRGEGGKGRGGKGRGGKGRGG